MRNQAKAYAYGLTTVLLWSTVASAFKLSLRHVDHFQLLLYACVVSILVLSFILPRRAVGARCCRIRACSTGSRWHWEF